MVLLSTKEARKEIHITPGYASPDRLKQSQVLLMRKEASIIGREWALAAEPPVKTLSSLPTYQAPPQPPQPAHRLWASDS
jgi:hypothetical protein